MDPSIQVNVIQRVGLVRRFDNYEHVANEVILPTGEKYIFDLTLDLYLIQSGCKTKQFGYTTDSKGIYDIIPLSECEEMDIKLGLIKNGEYTDIKIAEEKQKLKEKGPYENSRQKYENYIATVSSLVPSFSGAFESKQFINKLLMDFLDVPFKEFNLSYVDDSGNQLATCFVIYTKDGEELWYIYNVKLGILKTTRQNVFSMLDSGWTTNSETLKNLKNENTKNI